jgi:hypothetical protein
MEVGSNIQIGKILAANAMLSGTVIEFKPLAGKLEKVEKRGYLREVTTFKNKETGLEEKKVSYKKVIYYTYSVRNVSVVSLKYQLTSVETGAVMVSEVVREVFDDEANYATFDGDNNNLVPGYWDKINKDSEKDYISDTQSEVSNLKRLLNAKRDIASVSQLTDKAINEIASKVAQKINRYNPEQ